MGQEILIQERKQAGRVPSALTFWVVDKR